MIKLCEVEALFGSVSRGDSDELSDKDIILIDVDYKVLNARAKELESQGASVAAYSWTRFLALVEKKTLFVQHLKLESKILVDREGQYNRVLNDYVPKQSYNLEIEDNKKLLQLIQTYPASPRGLLWAADVLYVALRNYGILRLAEEKKYIFSYEEIIAELCELNVLPRHSKSEFIKLRFLKSLYRTHESPPLSSSYEFFTNLLSQCPKEFFPSAPSCLSPAIIVVNIEAINSDASPYVTLRELEKLYVSLLSLAPSLAKKKTFQMLKRWIEDPRQYGCLAMKDAPALFELLKGEEIRLISDKKAISSSISLKG